jgi:hypothetical protein
MAAIQFTDRRTASRLSVESLALARAASAAMSAPSMSLGRPWRWRIDGPVLSLYADHEGLAGADDLRMRAVTGGVVLHHARMALAADGVAAAVRYLPDPATADLLATIDHAGTAHAGAGEVRLYRAIAVRRSDSRSFSLTPVPDAALERLVTAAQRPGIRIRRQGDFLDVHPEGDAVEDLLGAGEATSTILLTAHAEGLSTELSRGRDAAVATVRIGVPVFHPR